jgi:integrase
VSSYFNHLLNELAPLEVEPLDRPPCGFPRFGSEVVDRGLVDLTTRLLERFSAELMESGGKRGELSQNTVWSYVKAVRGFIAWAKVEGEDVDAEARLPKLPQRHIEVLTRDEVRRMEDVADSERDKLIVRVLADTGVRVDELVKLRERDLVEQYRTEAFFRVATSCLCRGAGRRTDATKRSPRVAYSK